MQKLSYASIRELFISSKHAWATFVEVVFHFSTRDCGQLLLSQPILRVERLLWNWAAWMESAVGEGRKDNTFALQQASEPLNICLSGAVWVWWNKDKLTLKK